ncbi:GAF domain-containing SpoIIE family protein phosphatase [Streptomyces sp. NPDC048483]|uniref:PP2C family protein-serine/threonine phosphatase n=1 Tax=Streptomyces sp. NPDC048483 TaxID=3154927 RepID=UPI0034433CD6
MEPEDPLPPDVRLRLDAEWDRVTEQLHSLAEAHERLQELLDAVLAISRELELPVVLRKIVATAMDLVGARYGALGVLDEERTGLSAFITVGMTERELANMAGVGQPRGRGLLGHLIHHPEPLRADDIPSHPHAVGFPPGHPPMRTLLGVAISVRGEIYGDLYLADRRDGQPFDTEDEAVVLALAGAAGVAIDKARLFDQVRAGAEQFQRLLLPHLPDLRPFTAAAIYRPATTPGLLGGDWYDAVLLPDHACAIVVGDVVGHDMQAAAAMAQTRNMLRALLYDRCSPPSAVLTQLDRTLHAITDDPVATACLARIEPGEDAWTLRWSSAGHLPPLLITPDGRTEYLDAEPGLPLGVDAAQPRPDHTHSVPVGATVIFFTDGLVEHPDHPIDTSLSTLAATAIAHAELPLDELCQTLADHHPGDGHDDIAILAVRTPPLA